MKYLAYFDCLGFESIFDCTAYERDQVWSALCSTAPKISLPLGAMLWRARANPQRSPEIWIFHSDLSREDLMSLAEHSAQALADAIRSTGTSVFVTDRGPTPVIV